jgi:hypothetical protein
MGGEEVKTLLVLATGLLLGVLVGLAWPERDRGPGKRLLTIEYRHDPGLRHVVEGRWKDDAIGGVWRMTYRDREAAIRDIEAAHGEGKVVWPPGEGEEKTLWPRE